MKGKKKGVLLLLMLMSVFMLLPLGASAAKLNMTTPLKYAKRGYKIIAWNKSDTSRAYVYQQANFKNGTYGSLEKGGGIVVNMSRVNYQTRNMKNKQLTWIPVYLHNNKQRSGDRLCECEEYCPDCCKHQQCFFQQYGTDSHQLRLQISGYPFHSGRKLHHEWHRLCDLYKADL